MKDLTEYARAVDQANTDQQARQLIIEMIEKFDHKDKQKLFAHQIQRKNKKQLQKMAWDIVLTGFDQKVIKVQ